MEKSTKMFDFLKEIQINLNSLLIFYFLKIIEQHFEESLLMK